MARLILEEGGQRRRFKLNEGKMTIGSGDGATLTVDSDDVAELHAELEFRKDSAVLRLKQGVAPAVVKGRSATGEITMPHGVAVQIGGAKLTVEYEGREAETLIDRRKKETRAEAAKARAAVAAATAGGGDGGRPRTAVQRTRRPGSSKPGIPSWLVVLIILAVAIGGFQIFKTTTKDVGARSFSEEASRHRIERELENANFLAALGELEKVDAQELSPEWKAVFEKLRAEAQEQQEYAELAEYNNRGTVYLETQINRFEKNHLKSTNRPQVRVFLKRLTHFKKEWPKHPDLDRIDRLIARYSKIVTLSDAPTFEDIEFEAKSLTWAFPRDYRQGLALLEKFMVNASEEDRARTLALIEQHKEDRQEYYVDRMEQAKYLAERKEEGKAIEFLVQIVIKIGDRDMENEAARAIVSAPGVEDALRGYKNTRPEDFHSLVQNETVRAFCDQKGIL